MKGYLEQVPGSVKPFDILGVCNLRITDLPEFKNSEGRQSLCWSYALGRCTHQNCKFKEGGGHPESVSDAFATEVCRVLQPCITAIVENGEAPAKKVKFEERR